jgi:hypothetical protein
MQEGVVDFVEPDPKGKHAQVRIKVTPEDTDALRKEIERVAGEIMAISFTDAVCDIQDCPWCSMPIEIPKREPALKQKPSVRKSKKPRAKQAVKAARARYR